MGLFSNLGIGASALLGQQSRAAATGHNIANINTPGHTRVSAKINSNPLMLGGGVVVGSTLGATDPILAGRERAASAEMGRASDLAATAAAFEEQLVNGGPGLVDAIAEMFGSFSDLSVNPADTSRRASTVASAQKVAAQFQWLGESIRAAREDTNNRIEAFAARANQLAEQIAEANRAIAQKTDPAIYDQRREAARELAELTGADAKIDNDGMLRVVMDNGAVLVDGIHPSTVRTVPGPVGNGNNVRVEVSVGSGSRDVTDSISGGRLGAQIHFRDVVTTEFETRIDNLAFDLANEVNAVHRSFAGLDGATGRDFFTPPAAADGAATDFSVDAALVADPDLLAGADPALGPGDNQGFLALADLAESTIARGGTRTAINEGIEALQSVGSVTATAQSDSQVAELRSDSLASIRDSLSGVSLEEELNRLSEIQRAAEASSVYLRTVDELLGNLLAI